MSTHAFVSGDFRTQFPEFANTTTYPDSMLNGYWLMACAYLSPNDGIILNGDQLQIALYMMTAHLAKSFSMLNAGQNSVVVSGSSEGSVSVSLTPPPAKTAYQWWLSTTGYGAQLRALMLVIGAGGAMAGGSLERSAFRKAGGLF